MSLPSEQTPGPDHAAPQQRGPIAAILNNITLRTAAQGIGLDVLLAVCLVAYQALSADTPDYRLLGLVVLKTALQTAVSGIMKRVRPPAGLRQ